MLKEVAIRTAKGNFGSLLHLRWAAFFEALGVEYEYQMESFTTETGELFTPTFWLPEQAYWFDTARPALQAHDPRLKNYIDLAGCTGHHVVVANGAPHKWSEGPFRLGNLCWIRPSADATDDDFWHSLQWVHRSNIFTPNAYVVIAWGQGEGPSGSHHSDVDTLDEPRLLAAYEAAKELLR